ncbi:hypothetical protein niasHT_015889 [Heterodera trifolii]|uniref:Zinc finger C2HC5-type domain-containing protein n=1 Tax=Heterodera trifolii TaxID=157864 RepID=A0ABD2LK03_9BILA
MPKNEFKALDALALSAHLRPGRHRCDCQARLHSLVRNCIGCGRIVCAQEGSGRCFYCGRLVCTREEKTIIERKDGEGLRLLRRLLDDPNISSVDLATLSAPKAVSLSEIGKSIETANAYKQKLLKADKDQEVTRVNDLQADYFSLEHNPYLTAAEREAIGKRKEELRQLSLSVKRNILVDLDISTGAMHQQKQKPIETVDDPILQAILLNSAARNLHQNTDEDRKEQKGEEHASLIDNFLPRYEDTKGSTELSAVAAEQLGKPSRQKLFCVALKQPFVGRLLSLALSSKDSLCAIPWLQSVQHKGPLLIAALEDDAPIEYFNGEDTQKSEAMGEGDGVLCQRSNVILAKATLVDCITWTEFSREYSAELTLFRPLQNAFVLLVADAEALSPPIPHKCPSEFFEVGRSLVNAVNLALVDGGGIYEETLTTF